MTARDARQPYQTIAETLRHEIEPIKGSRFIADVRPVAGEAAARSVVDTVRAELPGASHHCWAYALRTAGALKSSDDGEPGGSAGRPILAQIQGRDLFDVIIVVTRYFGGTKLGVGGLVRAYGGAAAKALDRARLLTITPTRPLRIEYPYEDTTAVAQALATLGLEPADSQYTDSVRSRLEVADAEWVAVRAALTELTHGRIRFVEEGDSEP